MMPICSRFGGSVAPMLSFDDTMDDLDSLFSGEDDVLFSNMDLSRVDIDNIDLSVFEKDYDSGEDSDGDSKTKYRRDRNHDCMWGGQCCNKDFPKSQVVPPRPFPVALIAAQPQPQPPTSVVITHSSHNVVTIQKCVSRTDSVLVSSSAPLRTVPKNERSLLLNRTTVQQPQQQYTPAKIVVKREFPTPQSSRPETPQSLTESDDDLSPIPIIDSKNTGILRSALDAITTVPSANWEEDFFGVKRTKAETKIQVPLDIVKLSASSDHDYVGSSKNIKLEGLGVETPSDSEEDEEIDVVSLSERGNSSSRSSSCSGSGLPTRPTRKDQEALEEITTSLLSASEAVSRKLKQTFTTQVVGTHKRKKYEESEESSDDDDDEEDEEDDVDEEDDEDVDEYPLHHEQYEHHHRRRSIGRPPKQYIKYQRQTKRPRTSNPPSQVRRKNKPTRFGEEDSKEKRDLHNNMERMRRIDLRISFEELKAIVPAVAAKDRAAKVVILREAASYCSDLGAESQSKQMQVQALRKEQARLRSMVSSLRKAAAMACVNKTANHY